MIFRERCNAEPVQSLKLEWLQHDVVDVTDLMEETTCRKLVASDGAVSFRIDSTPGFLFLKYAAENDAINQGAEGND
jgi:hypothetical protein